MTERQQQLLLIYLAVAMADGAVAWQEMSRLQDSLKQWPEFLGVALDPITETVQASLTTMDAERRWTTVMAACQKLALNETEWRKLKLELETLIEADGHINSGELNMMRQILTLLASH